MRVTTMEDQVHEQTELELETVEGETKAERFLRLAGNRYKIAVKRVRLIGNLGNRNAYEYDDEQVKSMFDALRKELDDAEAKFSDADEEIFDPFSNT